MTTPDHDESKPRRQWPTYLAIVLVRLLVVYPLSAGPATVIACRWQYARFIQLATAFDMPLASVSNAIGTDEILGVYLQWCGRITNTPLD
jgi:hypothetical protein